MIIYEYLKIEWNLYNVVVVWVKSGTLFVICSQATNYFYIHEEGRNSEQN